MTRGAAAAAAEGKFAFFLFIFFCIADFEKKFSLFFFFSVSPHKIIII